MINWLVLISCLFSVAMLIDTQQWADLYSRNATLYAEIDKVCKNQNFTKNACQQDQTYQYLQYKPNSTQNLLKVIIVCNIHARELITSEICINFIKKLQKKQYEQDYAFAGFHMKIFYEANNQRNKVLDGQFCKRTNGNNIDLNRNFPTGFEMGDDDPDSETYHGQKPLSENFSKCINREVDEFQPDIFIDVHSGQFTLYHSTTINGDGEKSVLQFLQENYCKTCKIVSQDTYEGEMFQDMQNSKKIKWTFLYQVYGGFNANLQENQSCFFIFNPITEDSLNFYIHRWTKILQETLLKIQQKQTQQTTSAIY